MATCITMKRVMRSGSRPFSLDRIISSMSLWSFSMTTKVHSGVSNMPSSTMTPGWDRLWTHTHEHTVLTRKYNQSISKTNSTINNTLVRRTCSMATSFLLCRSCLAGKRDLSMTLMATGRPVCLWVPTNKPHPSVHAQILMNQQCSLFSTRNEHLTSVHHSKLSWPQHFIRENLIQRTNILRNTHDRVSPHRTRVFPATAVWE